MLPVRVLIADDQAQFRHAAAAFVAAVGGFQVVGEASTGEEAVGMVGPLQAELVLMDVRLPGIDGTEATRQILAAHPRVRVVLVSTYDPVDLPSDVDTCGAVGFVRKDEIGPETLATLLGESPLGD